MSNNPTTDSLSTLSDDAFWAQYHSVAAVRDHRAWVAYGQEFVRRYGLTATPASMSIEEYHARLGPRLFLLWETAQALYRGLPTPPLRTGPPTDNEARRYDAHGVETGSAIVWVRESNFDDEVLEVEGRVIVLFWAMWSGPDRMLLSWLREHVFDWPGVKFAIVNVDETPELNHRYNFQAMPTTLAFEGGMVVERLDGLPGYDRDSWAAAFRKLAGLDRG